MYAWKFSTVFFIMFSGVLLWSIVGGLAATSGNKGLKYIWKIINFIGLLIAFYGILMYTVLGRGASHVHIITFAAEPNAEFYREMVMNAFLYYPFGLTLTVIAGPWSVLAAFALSLVIETWQYLAGTGIAQGTDLIMNTLGGVAGFIPWVIITILCHFTTTLRR